MSMGVVLGNFVMAVLVAAVVRRTLGVAVGWPRTIFIGLVAVLAGISATGSVAVGVGVATRDGRLLTSTGVAVAFMVIATLWIFGFCLLAALILEIIAPTGSIPGPVEIVRRSREATARSIRYLRILYAFVHSGFGRVARSGPAAPTFGPALVRALSEAGVTFVKLGQILGTRSDLLPDITVRALATLQTDAAPESWEAIARTISDESNGQELFSWVDREPFAAASVAQVHAARTIDGVDVIVKVQRPGARRQVEVDCDIMIRLAQVGHTRFEWARSVGAVQLATGLADSLRNELDYRIEAENTLAIAATVGERDAVVVPRIERAISTSRMLVMERLEGVPLAAGERAVADLDASARRRIAEDLLGSLLEGIFVHGVFHADLHPGNIMILTDGKLGLLDFGSVGVLDNESRTLLAAMLFGALSDDVQTTVDSMLMVFQAPDEVDVGALRAQIGREITLIGLQNTLSMDSFGRLFAVLRRHHIMVPGDVAAALRSLASVERSLLALTPDVELLAAVREQLPSLLRRMVTTDKVLRHILAQMAIGVSVVRRLPARVEAVSKALSDGSFTVRTRSFASDSDRRWIRGVSTDAVSAFLGIAAFIAAVVLIVVPGGPMLTDKLSLYALIGFAIGLGGMTLGLRTIITLFARRQ